MAGIMDKILGVYMYVVARLAEPSTHASISSLLIVTGVNIDNGAAHDALVGLSVIFGGLGFFVKEAKPLTVL
jgi:hypothetical protein